MQTSKVNYNLKPGDEIVLPKSQFQVINHHAIYIGFDNKMTDWVIENNVYSGVRLIPASQFFQNYPKIKTVNVFKGNAFQREQLLRKVLASVGKPYDLFLYNCEHYTSDMLTGLPSSKQVDNFKEGFQLVAGIAAVIVFLNLFLNE